MLRGTWYYNKEIKVENGVEGAKIVVQSEFKLVNFIDLKVFLV